MTKLLSLRRDDRGAAAIEAAFALPVLLTFMWVIFQMGFVFLASAGMQHALGEGARMATIFPAPTEAAIKQKVADKVFKPAMGTFNAPTMTTPAATVCTNCRDLSVSYTLPMNFLFFNAPNLQVTRSKRIYLASNMPPAS